MKRGLAPHIALIVVSGALAGAIGLWAPHWAHIVIRIIGSIYLAGAAVTVTYLYMLSVVVRRRDPEYWRAAWQESFKTPPTGWSMAVMLGMSAYAWPADLLAIIRAIRSEKS